MKLLNGDCVEEMAKLPENSVDALVSDPPYGLAFMDKAWDDFGEPYQYYEFTKKWAKEAIRIMKPGAWGLVFGGTRTFHRLTCGLEDAGFEIKDVIMWLYVCLSEDTEILTTNGWKGMNEIKEDDTVFGFDYIKNEVYLDFVESIFKRKYFGPELIHLENQYTDQLLTPNHKVLCKSSFRKQHKKTRILYEEEQYRYLDAWQIKNDKYTLPLGAPFNGNKSIGNPLFSELIGWILTEGWFQGNSINISQSKEDGKKRIRYILGRLGIEYSEYKKTSNKLIPSVNEEKVYYYPNYEETQFYLKSSDITKKIQTIIPNNKPTWDLLHLPMNEKLGLLKGLMMGDGSGEYAFYQSDKEFLEWFQVFVHLMGYRSVLNIDKFCVSFSKKGYTVLQKTHLTNDKRLQSYDGYVWCIETQGGNFFARRNGKIFITGNSGFPKGQDIAKYLDKHLGFEPKKGAMKLAPDGKPYSARQLEGHTMTTENVYGETIVNSEKWYEDIPQSKEAQLWNGYRTCLKPAWEPIILIQKPREGSYAENILKHGVGGLNIDGTRIEINLDREEDPRIHDDEKNVMNSTQEGRPDKIAFFNKVEGYSQQLYELKGRYPTNIVIDELISELMDLLYGVKKSGKFTLNKDVNRTYEYKGTWNKDNCGYFQSVSERMDSVSNYGDKGGISKSFYITPTTKTVYGGWNGVGRSSEHYGLQDGGGISKFFYVPKASTSEREIGLEEVEPKPRDTSRQAPCDVPQNRNNPATNFHPTVKPIKLMTYLIRMVKPPTEKPIILDPFMGSGTTMIATIIENCEGIGIEMNPDYFDLAKKRLSVDPLEYQKYTDSIVAPRGNKKITDYL